MIFLLASAMESEESGAGGLAGCLTGGAAVTAAVATAILLGADVFVQILGGDVALGKLGIQSLLVFGR